MILPPKEVDRAGKPEESQRLLEDFLNAQAPALAVLDPPATLGFPRLVCSRLPLAESVLRLLEQVSHDDFLQDIFERYRGRSYERVISFPTFVHLLGDAL